MRSYKVTARLLMVPALHVIHFIIISDMIVTHFLTTLQREKQSDVEINPSRTLKCYSKMWLSKMVIPEAQK